LPAKNDNAVHLLDRVMAFAGKPRAYRICVWLNGIEVTSRNEANEKNLGGWRAFGRFLTA
jgi:hypothetical protein